jgi:hypothetical protein
LCNAPADYPQTELARLTAMRWPIETALEEGKGEVGLDHFTCTGRRYGVKRVLGRAGIITWYIPFWRICS